MTMEYTSIATTGGWSTNTVKPAWDLAFKLALNAKPSCRQFIDVRPERPTHTGDSITLQIDNYYSEAVITAAKAALTEESDVDSVKHPATSTVTLTPVERGGTNTRTLKVANRSMVPLDPRIVRALADWCDKTHDEVIQDLLIAGTNVYRAADRGTTGAIVGTTDFLTAKQVRLAVAKLRAGLAEPRDGSFYAGIAHPNTIYDLRAETGSGSWRVPNEYGTDQSRIWRGEFGEFEGVRWILNPRTRKANDGATSATVYRTFILGREALAEAVVVEPEVRFGPTVDKLARFRSVGWYSDWDVKRFREEALVRLEAASAAS